jgi:hypothetical protein
MAPPVAPGFMHGEAKHGRERGVEQSGSPHGGQEAGRTVHCNSGHSFTL